MGGAWPTKQKQSKKNPPKAAFSTERELCSAAMPLYYAVVARGKIVLCDHAEASGNFETMCQGILQTKREDGSKIRFIIITLTPSLNSPSSIIVYTLTLESRVSWVRVPPRAAPFSFEKEVVLVGIAMHLPCTLDSYSHT